MWENIWGNTSQYTEIVWPWPIAVYLFLAGLSAGALMTAIMVKWRSGNEAAPWDGLIKAGALIAPPAIILGTALLVFDLGKPLTFWYLLVYYNFKSVMSIGTLLLSVYSPLTILFFAIIFKKELLRESATAWFFKPLLPIVEWFERLGVNFEKVLVAMAIGVGIYTGFLISAIIGKPLFNTPILPMLFLISGISAGIAANILIGLTMFKGSVSEDDLNYLLALDLKVVPFELFCLFLMFIGFYFAGGNTSAIAIQALTTGFWARVFWIGVVGVGLMLPLIVAVSSLHGQSYKLSTVLLNSILALGGVVLLRFYILYAGQIFF
ncbi:polysulfide reductase [Anaerosporomusa subterranea]|uniref:Polysulfide reductase n=1 Tax=Anaerosporomusa subterranea TaxID=1794912 RepID=A0A154BTZ9_ANASB|nr:NrfD/PsrC family molybdoenzyme membrane anchor subunit [Anaerosporomusa subterranea]KYZ77402.1 polysulfide reductase [Anaerosporomusa subterranea]